MSIITGNQSNLGPAGPTGPAGAPGAPGTPGAPGAPGIPSTVGGAIAGGVNNTILFVNGAGNLGSNTDLGWDGTTMNLVHMTGTGALPNIATGTGAGGAGVAVTIQGTDLAGRIILTPGAAPAIGGIIATITFATAYAIVPRCVQLTPGNSAAVPQGVIMAYTGTVSTTFFVIQNTSAVALLSGVQCIWFYTVIQ